MRVSRSVRVPAMVAVASVLLLPSVSAEALIWRGPQALSAAGQPADDPMVVMSGDGTRAAAAWTRSNGSVRVVQVVVGAVDANGITWGATTDLSPSDVDADTPQVALSEDGSKATAVWVHSDGTHPRVQAASATISGTTATWGASSTLSAAGESASYPRLGLSAAGTNATAIWVRADGANSLVQSASASITTNVATWGSVTSLSTSGVPAANARLALSDDGTHTTAIWRVLTDTPDGGEWIVESASAVVTGPAADWSGPVPLSAAGQGASPWNVGLSDTGSTAVAMWNRSDGTNEIAQVRVATVTGKNASWGSTSDVTTGGGMLPSYAFGGDLGLSGDGTRLTAIWTRGNSLTEKMQSRSATISGTTPTWGTIADLSDSWDVVANTSLAVSDDGGRANAAWAMGPFGVIAQTSAATISDTTQTWETPHALSPANVVSWPALVAASSNGVRAVTVWLENATSPTNRRIMSSYGAETRLSQSITFTAPADTRVDQGPVPLTASASSGLPVMFVSDTPSVCTVAGSTATLAAAGTCTVTAGQAGDGTYSAADPVARSFTVTSAPSTTPPTDSPPTPAPTAAPAPGPGTALPPVTVPKRLASVKATAKPGKIIVKWAAPPTPVSGYLVQASVNKKKWTKAGAPGPTATSFVWKKGKKGTRYFLRVAATSTAGQGPWSKPVKVTAA